MCVWISDCSGLLSVKINVNKCCVVLGMVLNKGLSYEHKNQSKIMKLPKIIKENRVYLQQTGSLGVWIPKMEPSANAGEFSQPNSGWTWCGAELYILPSGRVVHHEGNWSSIQGEHDHFTVTVFENIKAALNATQNNSEYGPAYLSELLEESGAIDQSQTIE
jgi:hypothetical protein